MAKEKTATTGEKIKAWFEKYLLPCCLKAVDEALDKVEVAADQAIKDKLGKSGEEASKMASDLLHGLGDSLKESVHMEIVTIGHNISDQVEAH